MVRFAVVPWVLRDPHSVRDRFDDGPGRSFRVVAVTVAVWLLSVVSDALWGDTGAASFGATCVDASASHVVQRQHGE